MGTRGRTNRTSGGSLHARIGKFEIIYIFGIIQNVGDEGQTPHPHTPHPVQSFNTREGGIVCRWSGIPWDRDRRTGRGGCSFQKQTRKTRRCGPSGAWNAKGSTFGIDKIRSSLRARVFQIGLEGSPRGSLLAIGDWVKILLECFLEIGQKGDDLLNVARIRDLAAVFGVGERRPEVT